MGLNQFLNKLFGKKEPEPLDYLIAVSKRLNAADKLYNSFDNPLIILDSKTEKEAYFSLVKSSDVTVLEDGDNFINFKHKVLLPDSFGDTPNFFVTNYTFFSKERLRQTLVFTSPHYAYTYFSFFESSYHWLKVER